MTRTVTYLTIVVRTPHGYAATAPSFPHLSTEAQSARVAYARLKAQIKAVLRQHLSAGHPVPSERVVQSKLFRVDLVYLKEQEDLL